MMRSPAQACARSVSPDGSQRLAIIGDFPGNEFGSRLVHFLCAIRDVNDMDHMTARRQVFR